MVAQRVVDQLEVVEVEDRDAGGDELVAKPVLVEAPVVDPGERVVVQKLAHDLAVTVDIERLRKEEHARLAIDLDVARRRSVTVVAHPKRPRLLPAVVEDIDRDLAHTGAGIPAHDAVVGVLEGLPIEDLDHRVEVAVLEDLLVGLQAGHPHHVVIGFAHRELPFVSIDFPALRSRGQSAVQTTLRIAQSTTDPAGRAP